MFHPDEVVKSDFDPDDASEFWDLVNKQDWNICERVQKGMQSNTFKYGYYSPMEDESLDIRKYIQERLDIKLWQTQSEQQILDGEFYLLPFCLDILLTYSGVIFQ